MEDFRLQQASVLKKYNFPQELNESFMNLSVLSQNTQNITDNDSPEYEESAKTEGSCFEETIFPTIVSIASEMSVEEQQSFYDQLTKYNKETAFLRGDNPESVFNTIELIVKNFNISPKQLSEEGVDVMAELNFRVNEVTKAEETK